MLWIEDEDCSNDNNGAYYCSTCSLSYDSEVRFEEHVLKYHSESDDCFVTKAETASDNSTPVQQNLQCPSCYQNFIDLHTLNLHTRTWNGKCNDRSDSPAPDLPNVMQLTEELICSKCGEEFTSESYLESHMATQHSNSEPSATQNLSLNEQLGFADFRPSTFRQPCPICRRPFVSAKALKIHINKAHNETVTQRKPPAEQVSGIVRTNLGETCDECGRRFPSLKQAKVHKFKAHIQPRKKRELMIRQQIELKKKAKQFTFKGGPPQLSRSTSADVNKAQSHEVSVIQQSLNGNKYEKEEPNKSSSPSIQQVYSLKSGSLSSLNGPSFNKTLHRCRVCSQWFSSLASLISHRQIHHTNKILSDYRSNLTKAPTNNPECLSFNSIPNAEGLYTCHLCRKRFRAKTALRRHLFVHEHGKAFRCRQCGNSYTRLYSLKMHRRNCTKKLLSVASKADNPPDPELSASPPVVSGPYMSIIHSPNGSKAFRCRVCKRHFMNKKAVTSHLVKFHNLKGAGLTSTSPRTSRRIEEFNSSPLLESVTLDNEDIKSVESNKSIEENSDGFSCSFCHRVFTTPKGVTSHKVHMHYHLMKQEMKQKNGFALSGSRAAVNQQESGHLPSQNNRHLNQINVIPRKVNLPSFPLPNPNEKSRFLNAAPNRSGQPMPRPGGANSTAVRCPECRVLLPSQQFLDAHQKKFHPKAVQHASSNHSQAAAHNSQNEIASLNKAAVSRSSLNPNQQIKSVESHMTKIPHALCSN